MKHIVVSQRVDVIESYGERRDALDQQWTAFLAEVGLCPIPLPNGLTDVTAWLKELPVAGVLLTGGNDLSLASNATNSAPEREQVEELVIQHALSHKLPILGACRGAQYLATRLGAAIHPIDGHVATRHELENSSDVALPQSVNPFHNFAISGDEFPSALQIIARSNQNSVEAFRSTDGLQCGIVWHPEREESFATEDIELFRRHFGVAQ